MRCSALVGTFAVLASAAPVMDEQRNEASTATQPFYHGIHGSRNGTCNNASTDIEACWGTRQYCEHRLWLWDMSLKNYKSTQDCLADRHEAVKLPWQVGAKDSSGCHPISYRAEGCYGSKRYCEEGIWKLANRVHRHYRDAADCMAARERKPFVNHLDHDRGVTDRLRFYDATGNTRCDWEAADTEKCEGSRSYCEGLGWRVNLDRIKYPNAEACLYDRQMPILPEPPSKVKSKCKPESAQAEECLGSVDYCRQKAWERQGNSAPRTYRDEDECLADRGIIESADNEIDLMSNEIDPTDSNQD